MAPYRIVALSGYFCLPDKPHTVLGRDTSAKDNFKDDFNPYERLPLWNPLDIGGRTYDCPVIHFVTGLTEKADDPTKLIIAYGVNDCTSWFVEVDKAEIVKLLFFGPGTTE